MTDREPNTATWPTCLTFGISKTRAEQGIFKIKYR
jgi:hypothetical protein